MANRHSFSAAHLISRQLDLGHRCRKRVWRALHGAESWQWNLSSPRPMALELAYSSLMFSNQDYLSHRAFSFRAPAPIGPVLPLFSRPLLLSPPFASPW